MKQISVAIFLSLFAIVPASAQGKCVENAVMTGFGKCECKPGFRWTGASCVAGKPKCVANSKVVNGRCQCNAGFKWTGSACVK